MPSRTTESDFYSHTHRRVRVDMAENLESQPDGSSRYVIRTYNSDHTTAPAPSWGTKVERSWNNTPGYRALVKSRQRLPDQPFVTRRSVWPKAVVSLHQSWETYGPSGAVLSHVDNGVWVGRSPIFNDAPATQYVDWPTATYLANMKLLEKAKGDQWNVPIFLAEGRKTADMVVQRATHLVNLMRYARSGRVDRFLKELRSTTGFNPVKVRARYNRLYGRDASKAASNLWLETTYGWTPFMNDVKSAVSTLQDIVSDPGRLGRELRVVVTGQFDAPPVRLRDYATQWFPYGSGLSLNVLINHDADIRYSYRSVWKCLPNGADLPGRFGLLNPLEIAWELVPFSFVADWFLPIGGYLSSLDAPFRFEHLGGSHSIKVEARQHDFGLRVNQPGGVRYSVVHNCPPRYWHYVERRAMTSAPSISLSDLRFKNPFERMGPRVFSSIALLRQQASRFK